LLAEPVNALKHIYSLPDNVAAMKALSVISNSRNNIRRQRRIMNDVRYVITG